MPEITLAIAYNLASFISQEINLLSQQQKSF